MKKQEIMELATPVLRKYNFNGTVVLYGNTKDKVKLGLDIEKAQGGAVNGLHMSNDLKVVFNNSGVKVKVTSLSAFQNPQIQQIHKDIYDDIKKGVMIYGNSN